MNEPRQPLPPPGRRLLLATEAADAIAFVALSGRHRLGPTIREFDAAGVGRRFSHGRRSNPDWVWE